ncbi:MAG: hypothetical protein ORO03_01695 [Alphaproteobacteria bacterium]|nr:hypothetical protein [Alphaproteobacteria bacterium]
MYSIFPSLAPDFNLEQVLTMTEETRRIAQELGISIEPMPPSVRMVLRGGRQDPMPVFKSVCKQLGLEVPSQMLRSTTKGGTRVSWLGPDELYLSSDAETLAAKMLALCEPGAVAGGAAVDVSHRFCGLEFTGARAVEVLMAQAPLDLTDGAFPVGKATRTLFCKVEVILVRRSKQAYSIEFGRSFLNYVTELSGTITRDIVALNRTGTSTG